MLMLCLDGHPAARRRKGGIADCLRNLLDEAVDPERRLPPRDEWAVVLLALVGAELGLGVRAIERDLRLGCGLK